MCPLAAERELLLDDPVAVGTAAYRGLGLDQQPADGELRMHRLDGPFLTSSPLHSDLRRDSFQIAFHGQPPFRQTRKGTDAGDFPAIRASFLCCLRKRL